MKPKFTHQIVAVWMMATILALPLRANPTGEQVVAGSAAFSNDGSTLTITTSDRTIINWQDFSIGSGELTKFIQPSSSSATLNRVISGNPSSILGTLQANGQIYLINPNGILVGNGAVINTASFIASTLDVNDAEFMAGKDLNFTGASTASIQNFGTIRAIGGDVFLIAQKIENLGTIQAANGVVGLAAGNEVLLQQAGADRIFVKPILEPRASSSETEILNSGIIEAAQVRLKASGNVYGLAINSAGLIQATGTVDVDGQAWLTSDGGTIEHSALISAQNVNGTGGTVVLSSGENGITKVKGNLSASGPNGGGEINVSGGKVVLEESQLVTSGDLNISAKDTVTVRDSAAKPFIAQADGKLTLQGDQKIDIFAINHQLSGFFSGNDMVFRSANTVGGDAHYFSGGNFQIEKLDGSAGSLFSPYDPIIRAQGDVTFDSYTGASLHILAGGSVTVNGNITINSVDSAANSLQETVTLSDGTTDLDVDGSFHATVDIRAGTTAFAPKGLTGGPAPVNYNDDNSAGSSDITINGNITITQPNGMVFLTNQYAPNANLNNGFVQITGTIDTNSGAGNGGAVIIDSRGGMGFSVPLILNPASPDFPVILTHGAPLTIISGGAIFFNSLIINGYTVESMIDAGTGDITLKFPAGAPLTFNDDDSILDRILTTGTFQIGDAAAGTITIADTFTQDSKNIRLVSGGNIVFGGLNVPNGSITAGTVDLQAGGAIIGNGTSDVIATSLMATAGSGINLDTAIGTLTSASLSAAGNIDIRNSSGNFTVTSATTANGAITLSTIDGGLNLGTITASNNGSITGTVSGVGSILVDNVTTGGVLTLTAIGSINELGSDPGIDLAASSAFLTAPAGIGNSGTLATNFTTLTASTSGGASIDLSNATNLTVTSATTGGGSIVLNADGNLTVTTVDSAGGDVALIASGNGKTLLVDQITAGSGDISLAADEINITNAVSGTGFLLLTTFDSTKNIEINGAGGTAALDLEATDLAALGNGFSFITIGDIFHSGDINIVADTLFANPVTILSQLGSINANGHSISANGSITFFANNITASNITANNGGNITLTGNTVRTDSMNANNGGNIVLAGNEIDLNGGVSSVIGTGTITLQPFTVNQNVQIGGADSGLATTLDLVPSDLSALADGFNSITIGRNDGIGNTTISAVDFSDPIIIQSSGPMTVNGLIQGNSNDTSIALNTSNSITFNDGITTAGQNISIHGNMILGADVSLNTGPAIAGNITITGAIDADLAANNRTLTLIAGTGDVIITGAVGGSQPLLSLTIDSANNFSLNGSINNPLVLNNIINDVTLNNSSATQLNGLSTAGNLTVTSGGNITQTGTLSITGTTSLNAIGHDITLDDPNNRFNTLVVIGNNVSITENDGSTDFGASTITGTLSVANPSGPINLNNLANSIAALGNISTGGAFSVVDNSSDLAVDGTVTSGTDVTIVTVGELNLNNLITAGAGGTVTLASGQVSRFFNNTGSANTAIDTSNGQRYLIYSAGPIDSDFSNYGGLISEFDPVSVNYEFPFPSPLDPSIIGSGFLLWIPPPPVVQPTLDLNVLAGFQNSGDRFIVLADSNGGTSLEAPSISFAPLAGSPLIVAPGTGDPLVVSEAEPGEVWINPIAASGYNVLAEAEDSSSGKSKKTAAKKYF